MCAQVNDDTTATHENVYTPPTHDDAENAVEYDNVDMPTTPLRDTLYIPCMSYSHTSPLSMTKINRYCYTNPY